MGRYDRRRLQGHVASQRGDDGDEADEERVLLQFVGVAADDGGVDHLDGEGDEEGGHALLDAQAQRVRVGAERVVGVVLVLAVQEFLRVRGEGLHPVVFSSPRCFLIDSQLAFSSPSRTKVPNVEFLALSLPLTLKLLNIVDTTMKA